MKRLGIVVFCALTAACSGGEHEDLRLWMVEATRDIKGKVTPLPQINVYESATYEGTNLPDPFSASRIGGEKKVGRGVDPGRDNRPKEPLESYPLESLKYVGIMVKDKVPYAVIEADASLYQVKVGNYMGQNFGSIAKIEETVITLNEVVQDAAGDWVERESTLLLQGQEG
ncbi:MAG: pilus assembly protein PilP [Candidatus Accumulibacter sp.]|jgi:type IV pilus assembly protein PilP|nr:pilus assembly protein PilP [Accumulibacter sp.]